ENNRLKEALINKRKQRQRGKPLLLKAPLEYNRGALQQQQKEEKLALRKQQKEQKQAMLKERKRMRLAAKEIR
ncbi:hypothetical protein BU23DRAFT_394612, partial [Bimuria novae-zelandiae CBS 107.79]